MSPTAAFFINIVFIHKDLNPAKVAKQRRVRKQVDFGSVTHQNRHGLRAVSAKPTERILLLSYILLIKTMFGCARNSNQTHFGSV